MGCDSERLFTYDFQHRRIHDEVEQAEMGAADYDALQNKPTLEGKPLEGDMTLEDLGITAVVEPMDIEDIKNLFHKE